MKDCKIACFSDIHLGHKANDTLSILKMLNEEIFNKNLLDKINILIFAGDTFDRLLQLDYPALADIDYFFAKLINGCASRGVIFRVLEGTPSHDRGQPERFVTIAKIIDTKCDFAYVDKLSIEHIPSFDMNVLYIPDEWRVDNNETLQEVRDLMASRGLEQVDIAVMHGQFEYQIPVQGKGIPVHDAAAYEKLVRSIIFIGHVHTHSRSGKIAAQGSFDRLRHGEQEPKGYLYVEIKNNAAKVFFIENKAARVYNTLKVYDLDISSTALKIQEALKNQPLDICLRIEAEPEHPIFANFHQLEKDYPTVTFSKLPKDRATGESINIAVHNEFNDWKSIEITKDNVVDLVLDRISATDYSADDKAYIKLQLEELK